MKLKFIIPAAALLIGAQAMAKKTAPNEKEVLIKKMVTACKAELAKNPALAPTTDGEKIWRNLEDKEHSEVKLSKNCHNAHEKYEAKYHKDEESGEGHEDND